MNLLKVYLPQRPVKNWIGLQPFIPSEKDISYVDLKLKQAFPVIVRIDHPTSNTKDKEDYHTTVAYGIKEEELKKVHDFLLLHKLTTNDLQMKRDEKGNLDVRFIISKDKKTVFAICDCEDVKGRFHEAREDICKLFLPPNQTAYTKPHPHVTMAYGILPVVMNNNVPQKKPF